MKTRSFFWGILIMFTFTQIWETFASRKVDVGAAVLSKARPETLTKHVKALTSTSAPRNYAQPEALSEAALYIEKSWQESGLQVTRQDFQVSKRTYQNLIASVGPTHAPRIVIGAHYDVADEQPGADDNASGVAGLLELGRILKEQESKLKYRIDLVAYCLEEPPFFGGDEMGSSIHAKSLKEQAVDLRLMISLEMIGYFSDEKDSQKYPVDSMKLIYPDKGNFIAVVGQLQDVRLVRKVKKIMAANSEIAVESLNAPRGLKGVDLSDHRSYWDQGFSALMVTDTAFFRNPNYHAKSDTIDTLNFTKMAEVINGVAGVAMAF